MINHTTIRETRETVQRLLHTLAEYERRMEEEEARHNVLYGSREGGALRRASMDVTRALADLRKSR